MQKRSWKKWMAGALALAMLVTETPIVQAQENPGAPSIVETQSTVEEVVEETVEATEEVAEETVEATEDFAEEAVEAIEEVAVDQIQTTEEYPKIQVGQIYEITAVDEWSNYSVELEEGYYLLHTNVELYGYYLSDDVSDYSLLGEELVPAGTYQFQFYSCDEATQFYLEKLEKLAVGAEYTLNEDSYFIFESQGEYLELSGEDFCVESLDLTYFHYANWESRSFSSGEMKSFFQTEKGRVYKLTIHSCTDSPQMITVALRKQVVSVEVEGFPVHREQYYRTYLGCSLSDLDGYDIRFTYEDGTSETVTYDSEVCMGHYRGLSEFVKEDGTAAETDISGYYPPGEYEQCIYFDSAELWMHFSVLEIPTLQVGDVVTVAPGETKTVYFATEKDKHYYYEDSGDEGQGTWFGCSISDDDGIWIYPHAGIYQTSGKYMEVCLTNYNDGNLYFTFKSTVDKQFLTDGTEQELSAGERYRFVPQNSGNYYVQADESFNLSGTASDGSTFDGHVTWNDTIQKYEGFIQLKPDVDYYVYSFNSDTENKVRWMEIADVQIFSETPLYRLTGGSVYSMLDACFSITLVDGSSVLANWNQMTSDCKVTDSTGKRVSLYSHIETTGTFTCTFNVMGKEFTRSIIVSEVKELPVLKMGETVTCEPGASMLYRLDDHASGYITYKVDTNYYGITMYNENRESLYGKFATQSIFYVEEGQLYYLCVINSSDRELSIKAEYPYQPQIGETWSDASVQDTYSAKMFLLQPAKDTRYVLTVTSENESDSFDLGRCSTSNSNEVDFVYGRKEFTFDMGAGETALFGISGGSGNVTYTLTEAPKIVSLEAVYDDSTILYAGLHDSDYFGMSKYFKCTFDNGETHYLWLGNYNYSSYGLSVKYTDSEGKEITTFTGEDGRLIPGTYYQIISGEKCSYKYTYVVKEAEDFSLDDTYTLQTDETRCFHFTADRDMTLVLSMEGYYCDLRLYHITENGYQTTFYNDQFVLEQGEEYYLYVQTTWYAFRFSAVEVKKIVKLNASFDGKIISLNQDGSIYEHAEQVHLEAITSDGEIIELPFSECQYYRNIYRMSVTCYDAKGNSCSYYGLNPGKYSMKITYSRDTSISTTFDVLVEGGENLPELSLGKKYSLKEGIHYFKLIVKNDCICENTGNCEKYYGVRYQNAKKPGSYYSYLNSYTRLSAGEYYLKIYADDDLEIQLNQLADLSSVKYVNKEETVIDYGTWGYTFYTTSSNNVFKYNRTTAVTANTVINDMPTYVSGSSYVSGNGEHYSLLKPSVSYLWNFELNLTDGKKIETCFNSVLWGVFNFVQKIFNKDGTAAKTDDNGYLAPGEYVVKLDNGEQKVEIPVTVKLADGQSAVMKQPKNVVAFAEEAVSFSVEAQGSSKFTYQWQKSTDGGKTWTNSSSTGAKTNTLKMMTKISYNGYQFRCMITDATGMVLYSKAASMTVKAAATITKQPESATVFVGETAVFEVMASETGLTYQWQKSSDGGNTWVNSGSTGAKTGTMSMTAKVSFNGLKFRCAMTDSNGKVIYSNVVTLTVKSAVITTQPSNVSCMTGETATFKIATGTTGLTYQWQKSSDGGNTWVNSGSTGAKTNTLTMTAKVSFNGLKFRCAVTDKNGKVTYSNVVTLTVKSTVITAQPSDVTCMTGETATFKIATGTTGLTYQWQKSTNGGSSWVNSGSTGAKTNTLTMTAKVSFNGLKFRCAVTDKNGKVTYSNVVTLTVKSAVITAQPSDVTCMAGESVTFKVTTGSTGLTYQWQKSTNGGSTWVNSGSTGAKTNTLTMVSKVSFNGMMFRCVITDASGKETISNTAKLTVNGITKQPASVTAAVGKTATFNVTAIGEGLTYQWQKSTNRGSTWVNSGSTGAKTNSLTMTTKISFNGIMFRCIITDNAGRQITSNAATLTVE